MLTGALALARAVLFAATMLLFGSTALRLLMRARLPHVAPVRLTALVWLALPAATIAACLWFVLATGQMAGDPAAALDGATLAQALQTLFGTGFMVRMAALLLMAVAFAADSNLPALALSGVALAAPALTGHAASSSPPQFTVIGIAVDGLHLLTAGFWLGGLALLAILFARKTARSDGQEKWKPARRASGFPSGRATIHEADLLLILSLFSEWAMVAVLLLAMTGLINSTLVLLGEPDRISYLYLTVLGLKLAGVAVMLGLAAMNRFRLMPKFSDDAQVLLKRNVALELGLGIAVTGLAGLLGQLAPTTG